MITKKDSQPAILIVEDERNTREALARYLRPKYEITIAEDGIRGINLIQRNDYDLVLTDIKMPHKNGYEIFSAAKKLNHSPPVILMTGFGYDPNHSIIRAQPEGLSAVLYKPFKVDQLLQEVRHAVAEPRNKPQA